MKLKPDVFIVTGDHSTPAVFKGHSWHPVPVLLVSPTNEQDDFDKFDEKHCAHGRLGRFEAKYLMFYALAHARKLKTFGP